MQKIRKSHFEHFILKTHKTHKTPIFISIKTLLFNHPSKL